jgi:hypothetical protein
MNTGTFWLVENFLGGNHSKRFSALFQKYQPRKKNPWLGGQLYVAHDWAFLVDKNMSLWHE